MHSLSRAVFISSALCYLSINKVLGVALHSDWAIPPEAGEEIVEVQASIRVLQNSSPPSTYWSAYTGQDFYTGMQHNDGEEKTLLFSVWNSENSNVTLIEKGEEIEVEGFDGEGDGLHAMSHYNWEPEQPIFFKTAVQPHSENQSTTYSSYYSVDEAKTWNLLATFNANNRLHYVGGIYGFLERIPYGDRTLREGFYGNFSITNTEGKTFKITEMERFTHTDPYNATDCWQGKVIGDEVYMRITGNPDEGFIPPTCPGDEEN